MDSKYPSFRLKSLEGYCPQLLPITNTKLSKSRLGISFEIVSRKASIYFSVWSIYFLVKQWWSRWKPVIEKQKAHPKFKTAAIFATSKEGSSYLGEIK